MYSLLFIRIVSCTESHLLAVYEGLYTGGFITKVGVVFCHDIGIDLVPSFPSHCLSPYVCVLLIEE